jgi:hypothetical protein
MCLRFVFLLITRVITWLWLSGREETWKTAEILLLRHQVTVLKRHQACRPKLNWADRALLATLFGVIPTCAAPDSASSPRQRAAGRGALAADDHQPGQCGRRTRTVPHPPVPAACTGVTHCDRACALDAPEPPFGTVARVWVRRPNGYGIGRSVRPGAC